MKMQTQRQRPPIIQQIQNLFQSRHLTDPFFNTPIGKIIADSIINDFTYVLVPEDSLVVGEIKSNNAEIIYYQDHNKPFIKSNPVRFVDSLYLDDININSQDILYALDKPNYRYTVISRAFNDVFKKEFTATWSTKVYVDNELYQKYSQKIRFVPREYNA